MADELDPVEQTFSADTAEYEEWLESAAMSAQEFADANAEAKAAVDGLTDSAEESGGVLSFTADEWLGAAEAAAEIRDKVAEAAAAEDALTDSSEEAAAATIELGGAAIEAATAIGHERDEALEATEAMHELRDAEVEAGAAGAGEGAAGISMMVVGIIALIGLIAAVAPAVVAATGAFAAFALFAYEPVMQVVGAIGDTKAQLDKLPGPIQTVVSEVKNLEGEWKRLSAQFTLPVAQLMSQGLGIVSDLLPRLIPLAQDGARAAGQLMDALGRGLNSKGFGDLLTMMEQLSGPATSALIGLAGALGGVLLDALEQLEPYAVPMIRMLQQLVTAAGPALIGALVFLAQAVMDIGKAITPVLGPLGKFFDYLNDHPVFAQIAAGILGVVVAIKIFQGVMSLVSMLSDPWVLLAVAIAIVALLIITHTHQIAEAFDIARHAVADAGHEIAHTFDDIRHDIAQWAGDVRHDVAHVGDDIIRPFQLAAAWVSGHWREINAWLVDPIGMAVFEIRTHTHEIAQEFDAMRHDVSATLDGWRHDLASDFDDAMGDVARFTTWLPHEIEEKFDQARHAAAAALDGLRHDGASAWDGMRHDLASFADWVPREFVHLWEVVLSFLAGLPGRMAADGRNIIDGLIRGIESAAADIPGIMSGLAHDVESYFTDPLKIFSPSRTFFEHGVNTVLGFINGARSMQPQLQALMRGLGGGVATAGIGGLGTSGGVTGGASHPTVNITANFDAGAAGLNSPAFLQYLQREVQEAVARWSLNNPGTGFGLPGRV